MSHRPEPSPGPLDEFPAARSIVRRAAYLDGSALDDERARLWSGAWAWAGFEHWLGSARAVPVEVGGQPILLTKHGDEKVRAFHNVCRHRGLLLVEESSCRQRISCPYHAWSYGLDGALLAAPYWDRTKGSSPSVQEADDLGLLEVRAETWAGMVFVDLEGSAGRLAEQLGPLAQRWAPFDLTRLRFAAERCYDIAANWKLVVENFLDYYHLPWIHPQVGPPSACAAIDDIVLADGILGGTYPEGAVGKKRKAERPLPSLGAVGPDHRRGQDIFCVLPNALLFLEHDWFQVIGIEASGPERTVEHMAVFVDVDACGDDFAGARRSLVDALFEVNDQDIPVLERLQAAKRSPAADHNQLNRHWDQITARFQELVIGAGGELT